MGTQKDDAVTVTDREIEVAQGQEDSAFWPTNRVSILAGIATLVLTVAVWAWLPHDRLLSSVWVLFGKLTPFVAATVAIAWLDPATGRRLRMELWALPAVFVGFFGWFVSNIFVSALKLPGDEAFDELYYHVLLMVPFMILGLLLAYRLGGGARHVVLRLGAAMLLIQLSGIEDLIAVTLQGEIPAVWTWASHITVFLGHPASRVEAFVFIAVHLVLAVSVLVLPAPRRRKSIP